MRIILFGTGAMSCMFAARLSAVAEVTLLGTWAEAIGEIQDRGVQLEDGPETRRAAVAAEYLGTPVEPVDLAIVLVKSWQTGKVAAHLSGYLKPRGIALSLQNGLGNIELLGLRARAGSTAAGATLLGPGRVRAGGSGPTHVAAPAWVVGLLRDAGLEAHGCSESEAQSLLWGKLAVSCGINALTALLRVTNGELLTRPHLPDLMARAALECAAVARSAGIRLPFEDVAAQAREVAGRTATNRSSMLQDILRGAPTECDAINGAVVTEGKRLGVQTPVNELLWQLMQAAVHRCRSGWRG